MTLRRLYELGQDAAGRDGVQKRDLAVADAAARRFVDQAQSARAALLERLGHVLAPVRGVVKARPALREKAPDGRVVSERLQELDVRVTDAQERSFDALLGDRLAML